MPPLLIELCVLVARIEGTNEDETHHHSIAVTAHGATAYTPCTGLHRKRLHPLLAGTGTQSGPDGVERKAAMNASASKVLYESS